MRQFFKWLFRLALLLIVLGGALVVQTLYFKPLRIDWFYGRVFGEFALQSPDRNGLDREGRLSYDVLGYFLGIQAEGDRFRFYDFPVNQMFGVQAKLPEFMIQVHQVTSEREAKRYLERLDRFPQKFSQVIEGLKLREAKGIIPPKFTVEKVLLQMNDFAAKRGKESPMYSSFKEKLDKIPSEKMDAATRAELLARAEASIDKQVYPAYRQLIDYFNALLPKARGNRGAWHLPDGDAFYAWCVKMHTTTEMTPQQLHQLGLSEVARIASQMDAILKVKGLSEGSIGKRVQALAADPAQVYPNTPDGKAAMITRYQAILDEVNAGLGDAFH